MWETIWHIQYHMSYRYLRSSNIPRFAINYLFWYQLVRFVFRRNRKRHFTPNIESQRVYWNCMQTQVISLTMFYHLLKYVYIYVFDSYLYVYIYYAMQEIIKVSYLDNLLTHIIRHCNGILIFLEKNTFMLNYWLKQLCWNSDTWERTC